MTKQEGVIKFRLDYTPTPPLRASFERQTRPKDQPDTPAQVYAVPPAEIQSLLHWRQILGERQLIGQDPARYDGYGFGNISRRLPALQQDPHQPVFIISGTQTGSLPRLAAQHLAIVTACYPAKNRITACGPIRPSSESMTHAILYILDIGTNCVMHVHSPQIWQAAPALGLPVTNPNVPYGTPQMAQEVRRHFAETDCSRRGIFSMGGHEDGIVSFGPTAATAGRILLDTLERAAIDDR